MYLEVAWELALVAWEVVPVWVLVLAFLVPPVLEARANMQSVWLMAAAWETLVSKSMRIGIAGIVAPTAV